MFLAIDNDLKPALPSRLSFSQCWYFIDTSASSCNPTASRSASDPVLACRIGCSLESLPLESASLSKHDRHRRYRSTAGQSDRGGHICDIPTRDRSPVLQVSVKDSSCGDPPVSRSNQVSDRQAQTQWKVTLDSRLNPLQHGSIRQPPLMHRFDDDNRHPLLSLPPVRGRPVVSVHPPAIHERRAMQEVSETTSLKGSSQDLADRYRCCPAGRICLQLRDQPVPLCRLYLERAVRTSRSRFRRSVSDTLRHETRRFRLQPFQVSDSSSHQSPEAAGNCPVFSQSARSCFRRRRVPSRKRLSKLPSGRSSNFSGAMIRAICLPNPIDGFR